MSDGYDLLDSSFAATVIECPGPAPFHFVAVPVKHVGEVRYAARLESYGWGVVPVEAWIGAATFRTSLFPRDECYLLPLKAAVRRRRDGFRRSRARALADQLERVPAG